MNSEKWQQIKAIFNQAVELDSAQCEAFLKDQTDPEVIGEVRVLLEAEKENNFAQPVANLSQLWIEETAEHYIGQEFAGYKIVREIGAGGMGIVFEAVRQKDGFSQTAALKVLRRGMDSEAMLRRFSQERQILAALEHPHIARLIDGGRSDDGTPFFAMEYVNGLPIDEFCNNCNLSIRKRLHLFVQVCSAVSFAHSRLIIHRDLKPTNILVTEDQTVKLLDFGIAKIVNDDSQTSAHTVTQLGMMTPKYASPEQISGQMVSTSSDIYSLGLILYELLTGVSAYEFPNNRPDEIAKVICDSEPKRPSSVVSDQWPVVGSQKDSRHSPTTKSKSQITNPRSLRGDLDNIILKALQKLPARRYVSVEQFAGDIERHLDGLPVIARPDTFSYRLEKFVSRNRIPVIAGVLILLSLIGGIAATSWQAYRAEEQRVLAEKRFNQVRELANNVVFKYHDEIKDLPGSTKVREVLVQDALNYLDGLQAESGNDSLLTRELAQAYIRVANVQGGTYQANLGDSKGAAESYSKAIVLLEPLVNVSAEPKLMAELRDAYVESGRAFYRVGEFAKQTENMQKALALSEKVIALEPDEVSPKLYHSRTLVHFADTFPENETERKLEVYANAFEIGKALAAASPNEETVNRLLATNTHRMQLHTFLLAMKFRKEGDRVKEVQLLKEALEYATLSRKTQENVLSMKPENPGFQRNVAGGKLNEGKIYRELGDSYSALRFASEALKIQHVIADNDLNNQEIKLDLKESYEDIAFAYLRRGDLASASINFGKAVELNEQLLKRDPENFDFWQARLKGEQTWADALCEAGEKIKAKEVYTKALTLADVRAPKKFAEFVEKFRSEIRENVANCD